MRSLAPITFRTAGPAERAKLVTPSVVDLWKSRRVILDRSMFNLQMKSEKAVLGSMVTCLLPGHRLLSVEGR